MLQGVLGDGAPRRTQVAFVVRALGCTVVTVCQIARAVSECPRLTLPSTCLVYYTDISILLYYLFRLVTLFILDNIAPRQGKLDR